MLLGDYLFTHAFHLASTLDDVRACRLIGQATNRVCEGELCQGLERGNLDLTEDAYFDIIDGKTAELLACCCQLGALFSGASAEVVQALARFGRYVGLAFQIADDLLDLVGEEQTTGKSLGTDLEQQKMTLPLIRLLAARAEGTGEARAAGVAGAGRSQTRGVMAVPAGERRAGLRPPQGGGFRGESAAGVGVSSAVGVPGGPGGGHGSGGASEPLSAKRPAGMRDAGGLWESPQTPALPFSGPTLTAGSCRKKECCEACRYFLTLLRIQ